MAKTAFGHRLATDFGANKDLPEIILLPHSYTEGVQLSSPSMANAAPFKPLTKDDVASILGVSSRTIETWVVQRTIPAPCPIGGRVFWHPDVFYAWLDQRLRVQVFEDEVKASMPPGSDSNRPRASAEDRVRRQRKKREELLNAVSSPSGLTSPDSKTLQ